MEMKLPWTKSQKEFIGQIFKTLNGGIISVVGVGNGQKPNGSWDNKFILECSRCSLDKDLFPLGSLTSDKFRLSRGIYPCMCGKSFKPNRLQKIKMVKRLCEDRGYKLLSEISGRLTLYCNLCSQDKDLWGENSIQVQYEDFATGSTPCGCAPICTYTENQNKVRVLRECQQRGDIQFLGWAEGYKGSHTKLKLKNVNSKLEWESTKLNAFLRGVGSYEDKAEKCRKANTPLIESILNTLTSTCHNVTDIRRYEGNVLTRYDKECIEYQCKFCSYDTYVINGVCDGWFKTRPRELRKGSLSCRCSKTYKWSEPQQKLKVFNVCKREGLIFIGWCGGVYSGVDKSRILWKCYCGNNNNTSLSNFINRGRRCSYCSCGGYKVSKPSQIYLVRWFHKGGSFLKFGVTNRHHIVRVKEQQRKSPSLEYEVLAVYEHQSGGVVLSCETFIKNAFSTGVIPKHILPSGYTETVEDNKYNYDTILKAFNDFKLTRLTTVNNKLLHK